MPAASSAAIVLLADDLGAYRAGSLPAGRYEIDVLSSQFANAGSAATAMPAAGALLTSPDRTRPPGAAGSPAAVVELAAGQEVVVHLVRAEVEAGGAADRPAESVQVRLPAPIVRGRILRAATEGPAYALT